MPRTLVADKVRADDVTIADIDEALGWARLVSQRDERWRAYVDAILDQRLEASA